MNDIIRTECDQAALWNGLGGRGWVEAQESLDRLFRPFEEMLLDTGRSRAGEAVLDVGCGTGGLTLAAARQAGTEARCTGIDISEPMIAAAGARAIRERTPASFVRADAQTYAFQPGSFDRIISRFGVMFFEEPIRAFENLRFAAKYGGELRFIAWRSAEENSFMTTAERAAAPVLADLPARQADAPGQFAFADARRVQDILEKSGWEQIDIRPIDVPCAFPEEELVGYLGCMGPVGRYLQQVDDLTRAKIMRILLPAFDPYLDGAEVHFQASCWMVTACNPVRGGA